jgi:4-hydroxybenzoate polyprenyltransferase
LKIIRILIDSNIFIALAGVILILSSQVLLGSVIYLNDYIFVVFFGILLEYNLHKLFVVIKNKNEINNYKYKWAKNNLFIYFSIMIIGFLLLIYFLNKLEINILINLLILSIILIFYSVPIYDKINIRRIPFIKIFIISFFWTYITLYIPYLYFFQNINSEIYFLFIERFIFIFSITIPFDIRDKEQDKLNNIKTIPQYLSDNNSYLLSNILLIVLIFIAIIHHIIFYNYINLISIIFISVITVYFINNNKIKNNRYYYYGFLDGSMLIYGIIIIIFDFMFRL